MLRRSRRVPWIVVALLINVGVAIQQSPAHAIGEVACVDLGVGALARTQCTVPHGSVLYRAGEPAKCTTPYLEQDGTIHWVETEGTVVPPIPLPMIDWFEVQRLNDFYLANREQYSGQVRFFWKQCRSLDNGVRVTLGAFPQAVPITDPLLDIRLDVENLLVSLTLPTPVLSTLPEPDVYYGLKVNNPAWVAVTPGSWRTVVTPPRNMRGWLVTLQIRPVGLSYTVDQGGRRVSVACDPSGQRYVPGSSRFPTEPVGFTDEANWFDSPEDPLPQRPCTWTPRVAGSGTVAVAITYDVTASAGGFLFEFAPRTNTAVVPIDVTELRTVNLRPGV